MAEEKSPEAVAVQGTLGERLTFAREEKETPDVHDTATKIQRAEEVYGGYDELDIEEEKPSKGEVLGWFFYGLCSYFVHTVLIPVVFPLIISEIKQKMQDPPNDQWVINGRGFKCSAREMRLYQGLTNKTINVNTLHFSPLEWTSISWALGLIIAAPILALLSAHLDHSRNQQLIAASATAVGGLFCLPAGFFRTSWIFLPYVAFVVAANTVCVATYIRHLGLMVRAFVGPTVRKSQFPDRRGVAGWLSLYATASGCLGSAIISTFTYHMLRHVEKVLSLWIVSIFSGLIWFAGIAHVFSTNRIVRTPIPNPNPKSHFVSIFSYPHAAGSLAGVFLSSFATMCIFAGGVLHLIGQLCLRPVNVLFLGLTYFIFPLLSLPLVQPLQQLIRADAVKMQLLGFLLSMLTSGFGFYYRGDSWKLEHVLVFAGVQSVAAGLLHAFGRVLLLDCCPAGKEGAFAAWFSWVRALGTCVGFAAASSSPEKIDRSFGVGFCTAVVGLVVLIFGNVSNSGGAKAAGHVRENSEKCSPARGYDSGVYAKGDEAAETP